MKTIRIVMLGAAFTISFNMGLQAQTTTATDSKESATQAENRSAPEQSITQSKDKAAPATEQQTTTPDKTNQKTPSSMDTLGYDENGVCGAACS